MEPKNLQELGLTEGESKVYLALAKIGMCTTGKIIKEANVSGSKVYDILERLSSKGLVGFISKNNVKYFEAKSPERIRDYLKRKENEIKEQNKKAEKVISELQDIIESPKQTSDAEILKGTAGIKTFLELLLNKMTKEDTFYFIGANKESIDVMGAYFTEWHKRRVKKKIFCYGLYLPEAVDRANFREKTPFTKTRILPKTINAPAFFVIGADYSATFIFGGEPLCMMIKNEQVSKSYKEYFKLLWEESESP